MLKRIIRMLCVQDPYLKVFTSGSPGIRVDHAANFIIETGQPRKVSGVLSSRIWPSQSFAGSCSRLSRFRRCLCLQQDGGGAEGGSQMSAAALKEEGNSCFQKGDLDGALEAYMKALGMQTPKDLTVGARARQPVWARGVALTRQTYAGR